MDKGLEEHAIEIIQKNIRSELDWTVPVEFGKSVLFFKILWDTVAGKYSATYASDTRKQLLLDTKDYFLLHEKLRAEYGITLIRNVRGTPPQKKLQDLIRPKTVTVRSESISDENGTVITMTTTNIE